MNRATLPTGPAPHPRAAPSGAVRASAWLWVTGSVLLGAALVMLATVPPLPAEAVDVQRWVNEGRFQLTWSGELLFFAVLALGSGGVGMLAGPGAPWRPRHTISLVGLGIALVAFLVVLLALGRLVYPVASIDLSADSTVLVSSTAIGAVHLALLGLAVAAFAWPRPSSVVAARRIDTVAGIAAGVVFLFGSYPWLLPNWANVAASVVVGCWGVWIGASALRRA